LKRHHARPQGAGEIQPDASTLPPALTAEVPIPAGRRGPQSVEAFRSRSFRYLFASNFLFFNAQFAVLACQQWLIVGLTDSRTMLGLVAFAQGLSTMLVSPFAGVLTDRVPRRRILVVARGMNVLAAAALGLLAAFGVLGLWHVLAFSLVIGLVSGGSQPASATYVFDIVGREKVANAVALNSTGVGLAQIFGPSLGGALIAASGIVAGYFYGALFYLLAVGALLRIPVRGSSSATARLPFFEELAHGVRVTTHNPVTRWVVVFLCTTICASAVGTMRPVYAKDVFDVGAAGFGMLAAAAGIGGILGAVIAAFASGRVANKAFPVLVFAGIYFGSEIIYGLSPSYETTVAIEFAIGLSGSAWAATLFPLMQLAVPADVRGRVMSLGFMLLQCAFMGQLAAGALADVVGPRATLVVFGAIGLSAYVVAVGVGTFVCESSKVRYG
jgi:MFS family permease